MFPLLYLKERVTITISSLTKKTNQKKPRLNQEFRFISDISQDLTNIFSNQYFMKLTSLNLGKILVSLSSV